MLELIMRDYTNVCVKQIFAMANIHLVHGFAECSEWGDLL